MRWKSMSLMSSLVELIGSVRDVLSTNLIPYIPTTFVTDSLAIVIIAVGICLLKVSNRNTRTRCEICSKLVCSSVFIVNCRLGLQASVKPSQFRHLLGIYLFKLNNRNTRTVCEICSKLPKTTPERRFIYPMKTPENRSKAAIKTLEGRLTYPLKTPENQKFSGVFMGCKRHRSGVYIILSIFHTLFWCLNC